MIHTIDVLECSKDVVVLRNIPLEIIIIHINRKRWPDTQILHNKIPACAGNAEIETAW
jgi:hypothetical protein